MSTQQDSLNLLLTAGHSTGEKLTLVLCGRFAPSLAPTKEDQEALSAARTLVGILQTQPGSRGPTDSTSLRTAVQLAQELQPLLPDILPGIAVTGEARGWDVSSRAGRRPRLLAL